MKKVILMAVLFTAIYACSTPATEETPAVVTLSDGHVVDTMTSSSVPSTTSAEPTDTTTVADTTTVK